MSEEYLTYPLPEKISKVLLSLVDISEKEKVLTISWYSVNSKESYGAYDYHITGVKETRIEKTYFEDPMLCLNLLGYIEIYKPDNLFLTKEAFEWAKYYRKSKFIKWLIRIFPNGKDVIIMAFSVFLRIT